MPEPIIVALITLASGLVSGIAVAIVRPLANDLAAKHAENRAATKQAAIDRRSRVERMTFLLSQVSPGGDYTSTAEAGWRELPIAAAAVDDRGLSSAIGLMLSTPRGSAEWNDAYGDARHRTGELISQL